MTAGQDTYPVSLLSNLANTSGCDDLLERLQCSFSETFKRHVYLKELNISGFPRKNIPSSAPLVYAQACLSSLVSKDVAFCLPEDSSHSPLTTSAELFELGARFWIVTVETDNRESRNSEVLLAVRILL